MSAVSHTIASDSDAILTGCIPIVSRLSTYRNLFWPSIDASDFSLYIPEDEILAAAASYKRPHTLTRLPTFMERLESVPSARVKRLQANIRRVAPLLQYSMPAHLGAANTERRAERENEGNLWSRDAFGMTLWQLALLRDGTLTGAAARKHNLGQF